MFYFQFQEAFQKQHKFQEEVGLQSFDLDEMKRMYIETDKILLGVTFVVSMLHSLFECLAFKNDIQFWGNRDSMEGISVRSLYFHLIQSIVIFLYLCDNETSWMILVSTAANIAMECWKIKMASKVTRTDSFPYFKLEDRESYVESETKEYD